MFLKTHLSLHHGVLLKINIEIKNILKPLNIHFNTFLNEIFLAISDNIINLYVFVLYNYYKT